MLGEVLGDAHEDGVTALHITSASSKHPVAGVNVLQHLGVVGQGFDLLGQSVIVKGCLLYTSRCV